MRARIAAILIPFAIAPLSQAAAQTAAARSRTTQLVAMFSKHKQAVKEKRGVRVEKYKDVRSEPAVRSNLSSYSGTYETDFGFVITLKAGPNGQIEGSGREPIDAGIAKTFVVRNAKIDGALLTGTMDFSDGHREKLEGVFINRTSRESPDDPGTTGFGLGVIISPRLINGSTFERLFYERVSP